MQHGTHTKRSLLRGGRGSEIALNDKKGHHISGRYLRVVVSSGFTVSDLGIRLSDMQEEGIIVTDRKS